MMTTVESIFNSTDNLDRVFAYELLAAYWLVRSSTNGSPNNITVASRPDHVWRTNRGYFLTLEQNSWIKGAVRTTEVGVSTEVLEGPRRC